MDFRIWRGYSLKSGSKSTSITSFKKEDMRPEENFYKSTQLQIFSM